MLKEPLFNIIAINHQENTINTILEIDQDNEIFNGHFPDQPVVPGASMVQVVKEILETALNQSLRLKKADNIKFLSLVEPGISSVLQLDLTYKSFDNQFTIIADLVAGDVVCMKLRGTYLAIR